MKFKTLFAVAAAGVFALLASSCGYHMGSMMHPQIQSIAIADIRNDTREPLLTELLRGQLAEAIQRDGSLKLESKENADCVMYMRVINVKNWTIRDGSNDGQETYRPEEFRITVTAEFKVVIPGRSEDLIRLRTIQGAVNYQYNADPQIARYYGLKQACFNLANMAAQYTTEAW